MKYLSYLLTFSFISLATCTDNSAFGYMLKKGSAAEREFLNSFLDFYKPLYYIEFHSMTTSVNLFPFPAKVTLYNVYIDQLKMTKKLNWTDIKVQLLPDSVLFTVGKNALVMEGLLNYQRKLERFGFVQSLSKQMAKVKSLSSNLSVTFFSNSTYHANLDIDWQILLEESKKPEVIAARELIFRELVPALNKEFRSYLNMFVNRFLYYGHYHNMIIQTSNTNKASFSIKNVLKKIYGVSDESGEYFGVEFDSYIYNLNTRETWPLQIPSNYTIKPAGKQISLYFGCMSMQEILLRLQKYYVPEKIFMKEKEQMEYYGGDLTIHDLASFCPQLVENFDPMATIDFTCVLLPSYSLTASSFTCEFGLRQNQQPVLSIKSLTWEGNLTMSAINNGSYLELKHSNTSFKSIVVTNINLPIYAVSRLLIFMRPISSYFEQTIHIELPLKAIGSNWIYVNQSRSETGDLTIVYTH